MSVQFPPSAAFEALDVLSTYNHAAMRAWAAAPDRKF